MTPNAERFPKWFADSASVDSGVLWRADKAGGAITCTSRAGNEFRSCMTFDDLVTDPDCRELSKEEALAILKERAER